MVKPPPKRDEELHKRAFREVLRAESWRRERIINIFRIVLIVSIGVAEWMGRSGVDHDHVTAMPFVFLTWGAALAVFNFTWFRKNFRDWIPAVITAIDIAVLTIVVRIVYAHAAEFGEPLDKEIERAMIALIVILGVNVIRFSWRTTLWSGVCAVTAFTYLRIYSGSWQENTIPTDFMLFAGVVALLIYANSSFRTVTERLLVDLRDAQERRLSSLKALVAGVTHELNSPLGALSSGVQTSSRAVEILGDGIEVADPEIRRALDSLEKAGESNQSAIARISRIIGALGDFAGIDEAEVTQVDLRGSLDTCVELLSAETGDRIEVSTRYHDDLEAICHPAQLNQVFMHILRNAVQSIEGRGKITIEGRREGDAVRIDVNDTGRGIPDKQLNGIFSLQFGRKGDRVGMGLGLPISHSIVLDHGGTIDINSAAGPGTTVTLRLPAR